MNLKRRTLVENQWVTFLEDKFLLANGKECTYYHAQKSDAVLVIAIEMLGKKAHTTIVNQHRHPIGQSIWQFPLGGYDSSTEDVEVVARMELQEETGIAAGKIHYMGSFFADPGFTNQKLHVCATNDILEKGEQRLECLEHGLICKTVAVNDIQKMVESGEMGDAWGLAGLHYMNVFLNNV